MIGNLEGYYEDAMMWVNGIDSSHFLYSFLPVWAMLKVFFEDFLVYREKKLGISKA